jgi:hypothetical protein
VELARLLSTSSEGMSATTATPFLDRLTTVQGLVANHEQGRVNLLCFPKIITDGFRLTNRPARAVAQENFRKLFSVRRGKNLRSPAQNISIMLFPGFK